MKATGIVRRIDDLGRVVIAKRIRRTMRIREGEPTGNLHGAGRQCDFLKKYSLLGRATEFATQMCETLNRTTGRSRGDHRPGQHYCSGRCTRRELLDKQIAPELERLMESRQIYQHKVGEIGVPYAPRRDGFSWIPWPPFCQRGMCWAAWYSPRRRKTSPEARWSTSWPSPSLCSWGSIWRADGRPLK